MVVLQVAGGGAALCSWADYQLNMDKDELELFLALRLMEAFLEAMEKQAEILWVSEEQIDLKNKRVSCFSHCANPPQIFF